MALIISAKPIIRFAENLSAAPSLWTSLSLMAKYNAVVLTVSLIVFLLPILSLKIFGDFPLLILQRRYFAIDHPNRPRVAADEAGIAINTTISNEARLSFESIRRFDSHDLLALYAEKSTELANRVYNRAGACLLVGVIVSLMGFAFFYNGIRDLPASTDYVDHVFGLLPSLGILVIVESIAILLLRQHQAEMREFRYFGAVCRDREDKLVLLKMFSENLNMVSAEDVIEVMNIYCQTGGRKQTEVVKGKKATYRRGHITNSSKDIDNIVSTSKASIKSREAAE